ncbi:hypothetical protein AAS21_gp156 [Pantoea phage vB_PagS_AAS21]|uniref:Uncharacterized protein n=1 Tax=Pantoea phage vB_PagS_AAS21 TaxID=2575261 RepID=A0A4Y5P1P4_9CAUD|nr:hypothetical protein AAS21_gp156 [Pantoea phage vB_PagS_AAS21]
MFWGFSLLSKEQNFAIMEV